MSYRASRYHDISCGHTVKGHEGKCLNLHGHNYRIHFHCEADGLDSVGRVVDFSVIKSALCEWVENNWDHRFLIWEEDERREMLHFVDPTLRVVPFNPTAENMARHLVEVVGPQCLPHDVTLVECVIEETRKCSASWRKELPTAVMD